MPALDWWKWLEDAQHSRRSPMTFATLSRHFREGILTESTTGSCLRRGLSSMGPRTSSTLLRPRNAQCARVVHGAQEIGMVAVLPSGRDRRSAAFCRRSAVAHP